MTADQRLDRFTTADTPLADTLRASIALEHQKTIRAIPWVALRHGVLMRGFGKHLHAEDQLIAGLRRYVENRIEPGSFLRFVLENNLFGAIASASTESEESLPSLVAFIDQYFPNGAYGSPDKVRAWLEGKS